MRIGMIPLICLLMLPMCNIQSKGDSMELAVKAIEEIGAVSGEIRFSGNSVPISGVLIEISGVSGTARSDSRGRFAYQRLKPGVYSIEFSLPDFSRPFRQEIFIRAGELTILECSLNRTGWDPRLTLYSKFRHLKNP